MPDRSPDQSAWKRGWESVGALFGSPLFEGVHVLLGAGLVLIVTLLLDTGTSPPPLIERVGIGAGAGIAAYLALILLIWFAASGIAVIKQRNEARTELAVLRHAGLRPLLAFAEMPTAPLHVPAPGTGGSQGRGFSRLVCESDTPIKMERITAVPAIWFGRAEGGAHSNFSIAHAEPILRSPYFGGDYDLSWDVGEQGIWELQGLPITLANQDSIELPGVGVRLGDSAEAVTEAFVDCIWARLDTHFTVYTDQGRFALETKLPLVMSRGDGSPVGPITDAEDAQP